MLDRVPRVGGAVPVEGLGMTTFERDGKWWRVCDDAHVISCKMPPISVVRVEPADAPSAEPSGVCSAHPTRRDDCPACNAEGPPYAEPDSAAMRAVRRLVHIARGHANTRAAMASTQELQERLTRDFNARIDEAEDAIASEMPDADAPSAEPEPHKCGRCGDPCEGAWYGSDGSGPYCDRCHDRDAPSAEPGSAAVRAAAIIGQHVAGGSFNREEVAAIIAREMPDADAVRRLVGAAEDVLDDSNNVLRRQYLRRAITAVKEKRDA